jgi:hypothetical protein
MNINLTPEQEQIVLLIHCWTTTSVAALNSRANPSRWPLLAPPLQLSLSLRR